MTYVAPLNNMRFILEELCSLEQTSALPGFEEANPEMISAILDEAAKFSDTVLGPINRLGDQDGAKFKDGAVTTSSAWKEAYQALVEGGWNSPSASIEYGGMGLPWVVNACVQEMFEGANMAFQLCPMLTQGAIEALEHYASDDLKATYLPKMVSGEWTGTMNLTEPQAGSDLAAIRSRATPHEGHYRIKGQKIFITYGEHDLASNIIHLVLARLPDAPEGVKGISLFVVPKFLPDASGEPGERNDVRCVSIEHKLGIHGSPTCTLAFGDNEGAIGYLIGEPNRGLEYMFTMMNCARLNVGLQGIGVAEQACQRAVAFANERRQGQAPGIAGSAPIMAHGDVRRMLGLMRARTDAARALAYDAARAMDFANHSADENERKRHQRRVDLLIPVVKGWSTEMAVETASLGVQVHGGMGFVEETGAAQFLRDARITTIYEGTTGIQALDLIGRKIVRDGGEAARELVADMRADAGAMTNLDSSHANWGLLRSSLEEGADILDEIVRWLTGNTSNSPDQRNAAAVNVLMLFGVTLGCWKMVKSAIRSSQMIAAQSGDADRASARIRLAEFYCGQIFPEARARRDAAIGGTNYAVSLLPGDLA